MYPLGQRCMAIVVRSCLRAACAGVRSSGIVIDEDALWVVGSCFVWNEGKRDDAAPTAGGGGLGKSATTGANLWASLR